MAFVLDACAIIAFLRDEKGADAVASLLMNEVCMTHIVNICEVYYDCLMSGDDESIAQGIIADLRSIGLIFREDVDTEFWQSVALYKSNIRKASLNVSIADCFIMSLAKRENAIIITSDHHEFDHIIERRLCPPVKFIK